MANESNGNGWKKTATVIAIVLTLAGLVWSMAIQWNRLDNNCQDDAKVHPRVQDLQISVAQEKVLLENIQKTVDNNAIMQRQILSELRK